MLLHLVKLDVKPLVLLVDNFDQTLDDLISHVKDMRATSGSADLIHEAHLLELVLVGHHHYAYLPAIAAPLIELLYILTRLEV